MIPTTTAPPKGNGLPPVQPISEPAPIDPQREYAAGGQRAWSDLYARALALPIDDLMTDLGPEIYEQMEKDPQVKAVMGAIVASILAHGYQILAYPCKDDAAQADKDRAAEIQAFVAWVCANLDVALEDVLGDILASALANGNKISEKVWVDKAYEGVQRLCLRALKPKPAKNTAFAVDAFLNVIGILARVPGGWWPVQRGAMIGIDPDNPPPNLFPRDKFAVFTHGMRDYDPRGKSVYRSAYQPWWIKQQGIPEFLKYLAQFATPSIVGFTPEGQPAPGTQYKPLVNGVAQSTPEELMRDTLLGLQNGSVAVFKGGSMVQEVGGKPGAEKGFQSIFDWCDAQITVAILHQLLATSTADHQTQASTKEHGNILDDVISAIKGSLERMVNRDVIADLVRYNYGEEAIRLAPTITLGEVEEQDKGPIIEAFAKVGYTLDGSQMVGVDKQVGAPPRAADWQAKTPEAAENTDGADGTPEQDVEPNEAEDSRMEAQEVATRANAAGTLFRAGYDPIEALRVSGLPPIKHSGLDPITLRDDSKAAQPNPFQPTAPAQPEPPEDGPPPDDEDGTMEDGDAKRGKDGQDE